jgi:hypothetical protein
LVIGGASDDPWRVQSKKSPVSLSVPSSKFSGDLNSGIYLPNTSQVGFVIGNTQVGYYNASGLTMAGTGTFVGGVAGGTF